MKASCLCDRVTITLPERPTSITFCDCNLCRKSGAAWSYFARGALIVNGETDCFQRGDIDDPMVELHSCSHCAVTTHWIASDASQVDRMGANMRLFNPSEVAGIEARFMDGLGWDGVSEIRERRERGVIGQDVLIA
ncbi:aldehyde-activating protein [Erythrobacter sp. KY5]|uniref:GFA family protein n=1 Tax=Erythrobacter sp. KY5 TaxID=2011159 RepID=UPI000DBF3576|nr:aldehyde-activating protein [Erythrobacter sp. KY5]AWW75479.1 aldehyde-activating protein [Erythrobacter sp. KY5]